MGLTTKLEMKQGQALVMTPQLLQAIKLLQLSHLDLQAFVDAELERNPLLERADGGDGPTPEPAGTGGDPGSDPGGDFRGNDERADGGPDGGPDGGRDGFEDGPAFDREGEWQASELPVTRETIEGDLDTRLDNVFQDDAPTPARLDRGADGALPVSGGGIGAGGNSSFDDDLPSLEETLTADVSLHDHLNEQLDMAVTDPVDRLIGRHLIDAVNDAGYLGEDIAEIAARLSAPLSRVEAVLRVVQGFDPSGVAARDIAECLAIQLIERDRFDPAMQALVANLPLLAKRDVAALRKLCGVDQDDLADMIAEIRALDPKPGRAFGGEAASTVVPDVIVRAAPDGSWLIDLNPDTLPRVLVNQTYHARVNASARNDSERAFIAECLQNANWLTRSLEQRARTILKVASEIVRQQDAFFAYGVEYLRPLNLKMVADAIGMHESTVSRVTSNKHLMSPRGLFEMKYFFTAAIAGTGRGEAHSAEAVRHKIRQLIDGEAARDVLSDDAIVLKLKDQGVDIARRTVAKYREAMGIASSMDRRRMKTELSA